MCALHTGRLVLEPSLPSPAAPSLARQCTACTACSSKVLPRCQHAYRSIIGSSLSRRTDAPTAAPIRPSPVRLCDMPNAAGRLLARQQLSARSLAVLKCSRKKTFRPAAARWGPATALRPYVTLHCSACSACAAPAMLVPPAPGGRRAARQQQPTRSAARPACPAATPARKPRQMRCPAAGVAEAGGVPIDVDSTHRRGKTWTHRAHRGSVVAGLRARRAL